MTTKRFSERIMSEDVGGIYAAGDVHRLMTDIIELDPEPSAIKRLALCHAHYMALRYLTQSADVTAHPPTVDAEVLLTYAVPKILWAIERDPRSSYLHATYAQIMYSLQDFDRGAAAAKLAVMLDPDNAEAWRLAGNGHLMAGEDEPAKRCYANAIRLKPEFGPILEEQFRSARAISVPRVQR